MTKLARKQTRSGLVSSRRSRTAEPGDGGEEEAVAFIAEQASDLRDLAERYRLDVLQYLLGMVQLEADERVRSKRKLS